MLEPAVAKFSALDLFDSASFAFDGEATAPVPCQKGPQKSPPSKAIPKPSDSPTMKVIFAQSFLFHLS
jgi:hypothetical protein